MGGLLPARARRPALLLGLLMLRVLFAPTAVLADREPIGIVLLILHRRVVATFAIIASQSENDAIVFLGHDPISKTQTEKKDPLPGVNAAFYLLLINRVNKWVLLDNTTT